VVSVAVISTQTLPRGASDSNRTTTYNRVKHQPLMLSYYRTCTRSWPISARVVALAHSAQCGYKSNPSVCKKERES
jgi:hypothetical protein